MSRARAAALFTFFLVRGAMTGALPPSLRLLLVADQLTFLIATSAAVFENERRDNAAAAALIFLLFLFLSALVIRRGPS